MKSSIILVSLLSVLISCKALRAIDSANSIPGKLDATYGQIQQSNKGIAETNESVRLQKMILSKNDMLDDKNTKDLSPVALGMIPGAKKFGEAANAQEIMEYTELLLSEIKDQRPDDSLLDANGKFTDNVIAAYNHQKMINLNQIFTIAGFCPEEKIEQIINDQIYAGGLYQDAAYAFLMARVQFIGTYLQEIFLAKPISTVGMMRETVLRLSYIDSILKSPFKANVKMELSGFLAPQDPINASLYDKTSGKMDDSWNAPKLWKKVLKRFDQDLKNGNIVTGSSVNADKVQDEIATMKAQVQTYLDSWK